MFSNEINGYNKSEVDKFIANLKSEYEATIMEEKLKVIASERKLLEVKNYTAEVENRQKNIIAVLESYKKFQDEGAKNLENLRGEQFKLVYQHILAFFEELKNKYPGVEHNNSYKQLLKDISKILNQDKKSDIVSTNSVSDNDSMRILLSKMQQYKKDKPESAREVHIERSGKNMIKPVTEMELNENDKFDTLADKFLSTRPEESERTMKIQSSGFDLKEAISPTQSLEEIMKAFDFFGDGGDAR